MANNVVIFSEKADQALELVTAARTLVDGGEVIAAVFDDGTLTDELAAVGCTVYKVHQEGLVTADAAGLSRALAALADQTASNVVLLASDRRGRLVGGYLAQIRGAAFFSNTDKVTEEDDDLICERNILGGMLAARQKAVDDKVVVALSAKAYDRAIPTEEGSVLEFSPDVSSGGVVLVSSEAKDTSVADISEANTLVVVGQGVAQDDLNAVASIAQKTNGLIGCTKPVATDKKWYSEEQVVGISGKICKPELALLFGVSGQVQFYTGIRDAKVIVAVDKDENALITELADYVLIADSEQAISEFEQAL